MALTKLGDGSATRGVEEITGRELSWLRDAHDKFASAQEDITRADPGKSLAWLVMIQVLVYYLCTSIISTATYLGIFAYVYVKWVYPMSSAKDSEDLDSTVAESDAEPEWLLDQFFSYVQQHWTGAEETPKPNPSQNKETELDVPEVEEEPGWLLDQFLSYVQQHKQNTDFGIKTDVDERDTIAANQTQEILDNDQLEDPKESISNISDSDNLDFQSEMTVSVVPVVTSSVTSITNTLSNYKVQDDAEVNEVDTDEHDTVLDDDDTEVDMDDFEIVNSYDLNWHSQTN